MSEEAYEIGVTLALRDGVSEGIERARTQMAQLERVISTYGVPVQRLRQVASGWVESSSPAATEKRTKDRQERNFEVGENVTVPTTVTTSPQKQAAPEVRGRTIVEKTQTLRQERPAAPEVKLSLQEPRPSAEDSKSVPRAIPETARVDVERPSSLSLPQKMLMPGFSLPASASRTFSPAPIVEGVREKDQTGSGGVTYPMKPKPSPSATAVAGRWLKADFPEAGTVGSVAPQRPGYVGAPGARSEAVARPEAGGRRELAHDGLAANDFTEMMRPAAPAYSVEARPVEAPYASPVAKTAPVSQIGPTEGDVYLDGTLVGRWVARFLNQEAGRAQAGPTGFDARRSRLLPGATVGG